MREQINRLEEGQLVLTGGGEGVRVSAEPQPRLLREISC